MKRIWGKIKRCGGKSKAKKNNEGFSQLVLYFGGSFKFFCFIFNFKEVNAIQSSGESQIKRKYYLQ